jgi:DNA repair protein RecO (recombination protein O)
MLHKTRGIVFRFTKYGDTSIIVNIFTEMFGLQSFIVNSVRTASAKGNKIALYQPLTLLDLVVYHRENANINRIKEVKCIHPYHTLPVDVRKSTIAMFIAEVVNKSVKEQSHTGDIFDFLFNSLMALDMVEEGVENFHLVFLLQLSRYLGFGAYKAMEVVGGRGASPETEMLIDQLLASNFTNMPRLTRLQRSTTLDLLVKFYADHIDSFGDMKSVPVLSEVLG